MGNLQRIGRPDGCSTDGIHITGVASSIGQFIQFAPFGPEKSVSRSKPKVAFIILDNAIDQVRQLDPGLHKIEKSAVLEATQSLAMRANPNCVISIGVQRHYLIARQSFRGRKSLPSGS